MGHLQLLAAPFSSTSVKHFLLISNLYLLFFSLKPLPLVLSITSDMESTWTKGVQRVLLRPEHRISVEQCARWKKEVLASIGLRNIGPWVRSLCLSLESALCFSKKVPAASSQSIFSLILECFAEGWHSLIPRRASLHRWRRPQFAIFRSE